MAAIAVEPHQQQFVNTLSLSGLVFDIAASDGSILPKGLSFLVDKELRQGLVAATKDFFPGPGADNVVREILQIENPFCHGTKIQMDTSSLFDVWKIRANHYRGAYAWDNPMNASLMVWISPTRKS